MKLILRVAWLGITEKPFALTAGLTLFAAGVIGIVRRWPPWLWEDIHSPWEKVAAFYLFFGSLLFLLGLVMHQIGKWAGRCYLWGLWLLWSASLLMLIAVFLHHSAVNWEEHDIPSIAIWGGFLLSFTLALFGFAHEERQKRVVKKLMLDWAEDTDNDGT
jgi:hypothetical protein